MVVFEKNNSLKRIDHYRRFVTMINLSPGVNIMFRKINCGIHSNRTLNNPGLISVSVHEFDTECVRGIRLLEEEV